MTERAPHPFITTIPAPQMPMYAAALEEVLERHRRETLTGDWLQDRIALAHGLIARDALAFEQSEAAFIERMMAFDTDDAEDQDEGQGEEEAAAEEDAEAKAAAPEPDSDEAGEAAPEPADERPAEEAETGTLAPVAEQAPGEAPATEPLSLEEVALARRFYESGAPVDDIAVYFGVQPLSVRGWATQHDWRRLAKHNPALVPAKPLPATAPPIAATSPAAGSKLGKSQEDLDEAAGYLKEGKGARFLADYFGWSLREAQRIAAELREGKAA